MSEIDERRRMTLEWCCTGMTSFARALYHGLPASDSRLGRTVDVDRDSFIATDLATKGR